METVPDNDTGVAGDSLQGRVARAMYMAYSANRATVPPYDALGLGERERFERMAAVALSVAYREPVTV